MFPPASRPAHLSNQDCCYSDEQIASIDAKPIQELSWSDFEAIFTLSGCTAEFEEQLFYLPLALEYLVDHPRDAAEFLPGVVNFIAVHRNELSDRGFFDPAVNELRAAFVEWTATFSVRHFDARACAAKGWRIDHSDVVERSSTLCDLIDALLRYGLASVAEELISSWTTTGSRPESSAWLLEFAREQRQGYEYYSREGAMPRGVDMTPTRRSKQIFTIIMDQTCLQAAYDHIRGSLVANERSPTYWRDLRASLKLPEREV